MHSVVSYETFDDSLRRSLAITRTAVLNKLHLQDVAYATGRFDYSCPTGGEYLV